MKNPLRLSVALLSLALLSLACTSGGAIKSGEKFGVLEDLRVEAVTHWEQPFSDGFTTVIPRGTVVEATFSTQPAATFFECKPVLVNRNADSDYITDFFVPEGIRNREGFVGFSFTLPVDHIGTKLKALR